MVFASDTRYAKAIAATASSDMEIVMNEGGVEGKQVTTFEALCSTPATAQVDAAIEATGPDTIAKFLFHQWFYQVTQGRHQHAAFVVC